MDFRVFSQNLPEKMQARCVRKDAEQALRQGFAPAALISEKAPVWMVQTGAFCGITCFSDH